MTRAPKTKIAPVPTALPPELASSKLDDILLKYQRDLLGLTNAHRVVVCEKSRRIGVTWGVGVDAVFTAGAQKKAGGMDVLYIGFNLDLAREFIDVCAMWARALMPAASEVGEFLFVDEDREIKAFRIDFASGFSIIALSSKPRSLRGRQGYVIIDEAAFHDELPELIKAATALLIWGGRILVISTHNGVDHPFNQLVAECRAGGIGKRQWPVFRTTFGEAVEQGLYRRVCLTTGRPWSADGEAAWVAGIRSDQGENVGEELDVIPKASGGKYLARTLLEARAVDVPVLRLKLAAEFVDWPEEKRIAHVATWIRENLAPALERHAIGGRSYVGVDFGRSGDLSVFWPTIVDGGLRRRLPLVVELRNVPFKAQEQVLFFLCDHLPRFSGAALDARGNGQYLAEVARQRYGPEAVAEVMLSEAWYREHMPRMKSAIEEDGFEIAKDLEVIDDFREIEVIRGVARVGEGSRQADSGQRHGDAAVAACLAECATNTLDAGPLDAAGEGSPLALGAFGETGAQDHDIAGWNDL